MKEETAIRILKDLYDYGDLPQACLQALEKATTSLKYQRTAKIAIEKSAATVTELQLIRGEDSPTSSHEAAKWREESPTPHQTKLVRSNDASKRK